MVLSESGWGWALSWTQLGVRTLQCVAFSDQSMAYGRQLSVTLGCHGLGLSLSEPHEVSSIFCDVPLSRRVVCGHVPADPGRPFLDFVGRIHPTVPLLFTLPKDAVHHFIQRLGGRFCWEELRHRRLGGLTSARVVALWRSPDPSADALLHPSSRHGSARPLAGFLEPSVKLTEWRLASSRGGTMARHEGHCWCPVVVDATPYPWPWTGAPRWVEAETVYLKNTLVQRPLSDKELSQLMDLRED